MPQSTYHKANWIRGVWSDAFGIRGRKNILAWCTAGALAYYFYYLPEQQRQEEQRLARELARQLAIEKGTLEIDRAAPRPDIQQTGLVKGTGRSSA